MEQLSKQCENIRIINNKEIFDQFKIDTILFPSLKIPPGKRYKSLTLPKRNSVLFYGTHQNSGIKEIPFHDWHKLKHITFSIGYLFKCISQKKYQKYKYTVILSKTDQLFRNKKNKIKIPDNIDYIYINNINYYHEKIKHFPMGRDFNTLSVQCYNKFNSTDKNILCWCNFSLKKNKDKECTRNKIIEILKDKSWINFNIETNFKKSKINNKKWNENYYKQLNKTKFMICPKGNALETYRFYDSLYSGVIPIVVKEGNLYDKFKDLPILFLNKIDDFNSLTEDYLNQQYHQLSKEFKSYQRLLDMNYWLENICHHKDPSEWCF